jgi:chromate transporter
MIYLRLFIVFFQVGLFSFGGGYAALPLIQNQVVTINQWLSAEEMIDLITISQMTPGPMAINTATFVGTRLAGIPGSIAATAGLVAPACIIILILSYLYFKYRNLNTVQGILGGIRPTIVALIATAAFSMILASFFRKPVTEWTLKLLSEVNLVGVILFAVSLVALIRFKITPIAVILTSGIIGLVVYQLF